MALPILTPEQRADALKKAAKARQERAKLREEIKSGKVTFAQVMKKSADPIVARMRVATLLESLPGFGKAKAAIKRAFQVQLEGHGFSLVEVLSTCPVGWGCSN
jgi:pyruvate/2-oxoacid:ferredoxin oxidoreductase beta subunit